MLSGQDFLSFYGGMQEERCDIGQGWMQVPVLDSEDPCHGVGSVGEMAGWKDKERGRWLWVWVAS